MAEKIKGELLSFLKASEQPLSILVVESLDYLPQLRQMFPRAALFAVTAERERTETKAYAGLGVRWTVLDYLAEPLPFAPASLDYIIADLALEQAGNPQDIAAGFSSFLKQTGALLTSFRNIRHWSVLEELRDGHYYRVCARLFAKPEFERLLYASYYKDVRMRAQRRAAPPDVLARLEAAEFDNTHDDLETEFWLVFAARSMPELALLKSFYTAEQREALARLLHRIEYGVDTARQVAALWSLYDEAGLFPVYVANFIKESVFHPARFYRHLRAYSAARREELREILGEAEEAATSAEERALLASLREEDET